MEELNEKEYMTFGEKVTGFFKRNLNNFATIGVCLAYVLYGFFTIEETHKTIYAILATGALSFVLGVTIKIFRRKAGLKAGYSSEKFITKINYYGEKKEEIKGNADEIEPFCDFKNQERLRKKQNKILFKGGKTYEDLESGEYENYIKELKNKMVNSKNRQEKKVLKHEIKKHESIIKECFNCKIYYYTPTLITGAYEDTTSEEKILKVSAKEYEIKTNIATIIMSFIYMILFGCFELGTGAIDWANVVWCLLQVMFYLLTGQIEYEKAYSFVTKTLRGKVNKVISIIEEFIDIRTKNPDIFKRLKKEEKNK